MVFEYAWLSRAPRPPAEWDLSCAGWTLHCNPPSDELLSAEFPILADWADRADSRHFDCPGLRARCLAVGVEESESRAALIATGFGDAVAGLAGRTEVIARLVRIGRSADSILRERRIGPLTIDYFHRKCRVGDRWLNLLPREFGLLWYLADARGERVSRAELLQKVWRLEHDPETNSLEVHVSRLRKKLQEFGLRDLVETDRRGGYRLGPEQVRSAFGLPGKAEPNVLPGEVIRGRVDEHGA